MPATELVADEVLLGCLQEALGDVDALLGRFPNAGASTYPSETVELQLGTDPATRRRLRLFCKYGPTVKDLPDGAHRRGISYEVQVYRDLPQALLAEAPRFHAAFRLPQGGAESESGTGTGTECLAIEALPQASTLRRSVATRIVAAAAWLGRFHARGDAGRAGDHDFLQRYDAGHMLGWMDRVRSAAAATGLELPWLGPLAQRFHAAVHDLVAGRPTVLHGEFYPGNILATEDGAAVRIHPIDWESAGLGPGEIDLASVTMGWPEGVVAACHEAYAAGRWSAPLPPGTSQRLATARIYLCLRMLVDRGKARPPVPEALPRADATGSLFFDYLETTARELGWL